MTRINLLTGYLVSGGRRIYLTQGQSTVVDDEDWERLSQWKWYAKWNSCTKSYYACRQLPKVNRKQKTQRMHREVMGLQPGDKRQVDHENHNTLDNRKANLRICAHRGNAENRTDQSEYGVGVYRMGKRFQARIESKNRLLYLGTYDTPKEAQEARIKSLRALKED